jgi:hypothetical protein
MKTRPFKEKNVILRVKHRLVFGNPLFDVLYLCILFLECCVVVVVVVFCWFIFYLLITFSWAPDQGGGQNRGDFSWNNTCEQKWCIYLLLLWYVLIICTCFFISAVCCYIVVRWSDCLSQSALLRGCIIGRQTAAMGLLPSVGQNQVTLHHHLNVGFCPTDGSARCYSVMWCKV